MKVVPKLGEVSVSDGSNLDPGTKGVWTFQLLSMYQALRAERGEKPLEKLAIFNKPRFLQRFLIRNVDTKTIVGMATVIIRTDSLGTSCIGLPEDFYVLPNHRGHGYCTQLLEAIIRHSKQVRLARLELISDVSKPGQVAVMRIAEKLGFVFQDPYVTMTNFYRLEL